MGESTGNCRKPNRWLGNRRCPHKQREKQRERAHNGNGWSDSGLLRTAEGNLCQTRFIVNPRESQSCGLFLRRERTHGVHDKT